MLNKFMLSIGIYGIYQQCARRSSVAWCVVQLYEKERHDLLLQGYCVLFGM